MNETDDCLLKVKNDYLKFLSKEKIFKKSKSTKIKILKKTYIPISFWIENKYKETGETLFLGLSVESEEYTYDTYVYVILESIQVYTHVCV